MVRVNPRLSRVFSFTAFASGVALTVAAAAFAGPAYMKFDDIKGESKDSKHKGEIEIHSWSWGTSPASGRSKIDALTIKQGAAEAGAVRNPDEKITIHGGRTEAPAPGEAEITLKADAADGAARKSLGRLKSSDVTLKRGMTESAPGPGPGSVQLQTKTAWAGCRVGARYPQLELGDSSARYRLIDVVVTSCGSAGSGQPAETVSLNFTKIEF